MKTVRSQRWGYVRIIIGTVVGGLAGFYVMHRLETNYKAKWDERLKKYEEELMLKRIPEFSSLKIPCIFLMIQSLIKVVIKNLRLEVQG
ncbi:Protein-export protein SecB [Bienertia sinuspersici]